MVYKQLRTNFQKLKEGFVANILLYKNISPFSNTYYDLGDANDSLKAYFSEISYFSHLFVEQIVGNKKLIVVKWRIILFLRL